MENTEKVMVKKKENKQIIKSLSFTGLRKHQNTDYWLQAPKAAQ